MQTFKYTKFILAILLPIRAEKRQQNANMTVYRRYISPVTP